jgi:hypothetical protein
MILLNHFALTVGIGVACSGVGNANAFLVTMSQERNVVIVIEACYPPKPLKD